MVKKPAYEELEHSVKELERETAEKNGQKKVLEKQKDKYRFIAENTSAVIVVTQEERSVFVNRNVESHSGIISQQAKVF